MIKLKRRSFLKILGAAPAVAAIPALGVVNVAEGRTDNSLIREIVYYDPGMDAVIASYDVLISATKKQIGMDSVLRPYVNQSNIDKCREMSHACIMNELREMGLSLSDLEPLPLPLGYKPFKPLGGSNG